MSRIADDVAELTADWFTAALRAGGALGDGAVTAADAQLVGTGQLGCVARAALAYDTPAAGPATVIVKLPSRDAGSRGLGVAMGVYESEVRFYQHIAPTVGVRVPRLYWGDLEPQTGRFTLVLEDLGGEGEVGDMVAGGSVAQAAGALAALADLQAPRWNDAALHDHAWLADPARTEMLFAGVEQALPLFLERFAGRLEPEHVALVERIAPKAASWAQRFQSGPTVVVHGDYRMDNMIFPADPAAPVSVFDWQAARLGPPLVDACVYMGGGCLTPADRRAHERDLLGAYHARLVAGGVEGFSFEECWESYRWCVFYGLMLSVPISVTLERTDRGDALFAGMVRGYADLAADLESESLLALTTEAT